jgi:hypothetical protein
MPTFRARDGFDLNRYLSRAEQGYHHHISIGPAGGVARPLPPKS